MKSVRNIFKNSKGFTLIELIIVVAIIAALAIAVFVALNPAQRLVAAKDARRTADVDTILTAIHASIVDNGGTLPANLPAAGQERQLGTGDATACTTALTSKSGCNTPAATACADLSTSLNKYLKTIPVDPTIGTAAKTGYAVAVDSFNIVTVKACGAEGATASISASR